MSQQIASFNPGATMPAPIDTTMGQQASKQQLYVWNESNYGITLTLAPGKTLTVPPWLGYPITARAFPMPTITWSVAYALTIGSPPVSVVNIEVFDPDEPLPSTQPISLSSRATNIGNQGGTATGNNLINDGNAPATEIIEATPNDQGVSADKWNNDASGQKQILSAGVQRNVVHVVRGNATTGKAAVDFGDAGDLSITTFHGTLDPNMIVPAANVGTGYPAADLSGSVPSAAQLEAAGGSQAAVVANYGGSGPAHGYLSFPYGGGTLTGHKAFSGTGAGTFTHGLAVVPDFVGITTTEANSTETVGVDSLGSSTVHVNQGVAGWPWVGVATKN